MEFKKNDFQKINLFADVAEKFDAMHRKAMEERLVFIENSLDDAIKKKGYKFETKAEKEAFFFKHIKCALYPDRMISEYFIKNESVLIIKENSFFKKS